jgi:hypothetical protein
MASESDSDPRQKGSGGLNDVFRATDRIVGAAHAITGKAPDLGPLGGRRLGRQIAISMGLFLALFFAARSLLELEALATPLRVLIALAPLPAFAWFLWSFVQAVSATDELERRIQLEALAVAFPLTISLIMTLGLLQIAVPLNPDDWSYRHIWPFLYVFYLVGLTRARRRYL